LGLAGDADNRELLDYYKDRKIWLVEPDQTRPKARHDPAQAADEWPNQGTPSAARN
jgi:hypothetical protein